MPTDFGDTFILYRLLRDYILLVCKLRYLGIRPSDRPSFIRYSCLLCSSPPATHAEVMWP
jgi:hypothetical protein